MLFIGWGRVISISREFMGFCVFFVIDLVDIYVLWKMFLGRYICVVGVYSYIIIKEIYIEEC